MSLAVIDWTKILSFTGSQVPPGPVGLLHILYLKIPWRRESDGTARTCATPLASWRSSSLKKKNPRPLLVLPPVDAPNWFRTSCCLGQPACLLHHQFAAVAEV